MADLTKYKSCIINNNDNGNVVYSIWKLVYQIQDEFNVDFWEGRRSASGKFQMFIDYLCDAGSMDVRMEADDVFVYGNLSLDFLLDQCKEEDKAEFGADDWRTKLATLLVQELGDDIYISGEEV